MSDVDRKRKHQNFPSFDWKISWATLKKQGGVDLAAAAILELPCQTGLTLKESKRHKTATPSSACWKDIASIFDLDPSNDVHQLPIFSLPLASLPPSFHRGVVKASDK